MGVARYTHVYVKKEVNQISTSNGQPSTVGSNHSKIPNFGM